MVISVEMFVRMFETYGLNIENFEIFLPFCEIQIFLNRVTRYNDFRAVDFSTVAISVSKIV